MVSHLSVSHSVHGVSLIPSPFSGVGISGNRSLPGSGYVQEVGSMHGGTSMSRGVYLCGGGGGVL